MIKLKTPEEIETMAQGGAKLGRIKKALAEAVKVGVSASDIEKLAQKLIKEEGGTPSFMTVEDYAWATCINVNEVVVHGIPHPEIVFKDGDLVSVDVGILFKGFHTDTSISVGVNPSPEVKRFLSTGRRALDKAIAQVKPGNRIYDISLAIEKEIEGAGYNTIKALVGHGIGRDLHEEPQIPCFAVGRREESPELVPGMVIAIEPMYVMGSDKVEILEDGWTIATQDAKIAGLIEETVAVTEKGARVLTR